MHKISRNIKFIILFVLAIMYLNTSIAQTHNYYNKKESPQVQTRILFIFDASLSMIGEWQSDRKITIARNLFFEILYRLSISVIAGVGLHWVEKIFKKFE